MHVPRPTPDGIHVVEESNLHLMVLIKCLYVFKLFSNEVCTALTHSHLCGF